MERNDFKVRKQLIKDLLKWGFKSKVELEKLNTKELFEKWHMYLIH